MSTYPNEEHDGTHGVDYAEETACHFDGETPKWLVHDLQKQMGAAVRLRALASHPVVHNPLPKNTVMSESTTKVELTPEQVLDLAKEHIMRTGEIKAVDWEKNVHQDFKCVDGRDPRKLCGGPGGAMGVVIALAKTFEGHLSAEQVLKKFEEIMGGPISGHTDRGHHDELGAEEDILDLGTAKAGDVCCKGCGHCFGSMTMAAYGLSDSLQKELEELNSHLDPSQFTELKGKHEEKGLIVIMDDISDNEALTLPGTVGKEQFFVFNAHQYYDAIEKLAEKMAAGLADLNPKAMAAKAKATSEALNKVTVDRLNDGKPVIIVEQIQKPETPSDDVLEFGGIKDNVPAYYRVTLAA